MSRAVRHASATRPIRWYILVFLAPATIIYTVFAIWPIVESLRLSLYAKEADGSGVFVGLANYARLFGEPYWATRFANAFWNNVVLFAMQLAIQNPIALALAALLSLPKLTGAATYRTIFFLPTLLSVVVVGFVWQLILPPLRGITPDAIKALGIIFIFSEFLRSVSRETKDSARIDGLSEYRILLEVVLPLVRPVIATVAVFSMIPIWNDLWFPLILSPGEDTRTVTLGVQQFIGQYTVDWGAMLAALSVAILPVLVLCVVFSRQLIRGITAGAVKG